MKRLIFILLSLLFLTSCKAKVDYFIEYALLPDNTYEVTRIDYVVNDPRYP
jgi:PBP1b-binding outer membrane lipoprotein LpoB